MAQKNKKKVKSKVIHYGNYRIYANGTVERIKKARGTWIGKVLSPYTMGPGFNEYVCLCHKGVTKQYNVDTLVSYHFG